tara:strand:+ start:87 stop:221 length:135 start_codon:yes stop_codon:yes gene_type:complete
VEVLVSFVDIDFSVVEAIEKGIAQTYRILVGNLVLGVGVGVGGD